MRTNLEKNSDVIEFRAKNHQPDRADPETAKKAIAQIRENLGDDVDPMAAIWDRKLNEVQKRGLWIVAGLADETSDKLFNWKYEWRVLTDAQKQSLVKVISTFAGLATRIKGALS